MTRLGPLVPSTARLGGGFLAIGSLEFVVLSIVTQLHYPGYSDFSNYISDLGGPSSPWAWLFNDSIRLLGVLGVIGTVLIRTAFPAKRLARAGIFFLLLASVAAFLVGSFPESTGGTSEDALHSTFSSLTFIASGLALVLLGAGTLRDTRWDGYRGYTFFSGIATFVGIVLFEVDPGGAGLVGLWERVIVAPILLWAIVAGIHLIRLPAFAPSSLPS